MIRFYRGPEYDLRAGGLDGFLDVRHGLRQILGVHNRVNLTPALNAGKNGSAMPGI
jgi:hypothetical protein